MGERLPGQLGDERAPVAGRDGRDDYPGSERGDALPLGLRQQGADARQQGQLGTRLCHPAGNDGDGHRHRRRVLADGMENTQLITNSKT